MSPELPSALKLALERELAHVSRRDLAQRREATTAAYRAGGGSAAVIRTREDALAYALSRLPATYAACSAALAAAQAAAPGLTPRSLLDAGCGPGGGSWAALEAFPELVEVTWMDASAPFLDLGARLAQDGPQPLRTARAHRVDLTAAGDLPTADLVLASYALAEISPSAVGDLVRRLWAACAGLMVLVEPGTPAGFARLRAIRTQLVAEGAGLLAPCPQSAACPMSGSDWCHFSVRLPRSRDHRLAKGADAPFEDEKFAYLVFARGEATAGARGARVLSPPRAGKPGIELKLCGPEGLERRFVARRDKAAHATARRLGWGDRTD